MAPTCSGYTYKVCGELFKMALTCLGYLKGLHGALHRKVPGFTRTMLPSCCCKGSRALCWNRPGFLWGFAESFSVLEHQNYFITEFFPKRIKKTRKNDHAAGVSELH